MIIKPDCSAVRFGFSTVFQLPFLSFKLSSLKSAYYNRETKTAPEPIEMIDDKQIIELFFARKELAIAKTKEKYGARINAVACNILHNPRDAEEVENDTYLEAWNRIPPYDPGKFLYAFLIRITRHLAIDLYRKETAEKRSAEVVELSAELENCLPAAGTPEEEILAKQLGELVHQFLMKCHEESRNIFIRRYYFLEPIRDIAVRYHLNENTVKSSLFSTRKALKKYLEKEWNQQ